MVGVTGSHLRLVRPGDDDLPGEPERGADDPAIRVARAAWELTGQTLGTLYGFRAAEITQQLARRAPELLGRQVPAAVTWLVAEELRVLGPTGPLRPSQLARELHSTAPVLRRAAHRIRDALAG